MMKLKRGIVSKTNKMAETPKNFILTQGGTFVPLHDLKIDPSDRAWASGDGVFTTLKVEKGIPVDLEAHLERLRLHASILGISPPDIVPEQILSCIPAGDWRMKIIVTGGRGGALGLPKGRYGETILNFSPLPPVPSVFKVCLYPHPIDTPLARIKSLAYLERLMVVQYALDQGCDDAWVCDSQGILLEGGRTNVFWTIGRNFYTPDPKLPLLYGLTAQREAERYQALDYEIHYVAIAPSEIPAEAQIFATNSLIGVIQIQQQKI
jgi:4-amino-4-deoxychorismate lyase